MPTGIATTSANAMLDALLGGATLTPPANVYIQLHVTGSTPGAAGTLNVAGNNIRKLVTFGTAGATGAGIKANSAAIVWSTTDVNTSEDYTFFTLWANGATVGTGTFLDSGIVTANQVTAGDTFTIPIAGLKITLTTAG